MLNCQHKYIDGTCRLCGILSYSDEIIAYKHHYFKSHSKAKQLFYDLSNYKIDYEQRSELIEYLYQIKNTLSLTDQTFHLSVHYMDRCKNLMQIHNQKIIAAYCILISAKVTEQDTHIPGLYKIAQASGLEISIQQQKQAEYLILKELDWKLQISTLFDQVQTLLCMGVLFSTDQIDGPIDQNMINFLCCKMLKDHSRIVYQVIKISQFNEINTTILAMAIILYMRKQCHLHPLYPQQLQKIISEDKNQLLIDTYGQLNNLLNSTSMSNTKSVSRALSPISLQTCKSMPPMNRVVQNNTRIPLKIITNQNGIKPKLIKSKHQDIDLNPLRVKPKITN